MHHLPQAAPRSLLKPARLKLCQSPQKGRTQPSPRRLCPRLPQRYPAHLLNLHRQHRPIHTLRVLRHRAKQRRTHRQKHGHRARSRGQLLWRQVVHRQLHRARDPRLCRPSLLARPASGRPAVYQQRHRRLQAPRLGLALAAPHLLRPWHRPVQAPPCAIIAVQAFSVLQPLLPVCFCSRRTEPGTHSLLLDFSHSLSHFTQPVAWLAMVVARLAAWPLSMV